MNKRPINMISMQQYKQMQKYPNPIKQIQGKRSRAIGNYFEDIISNACEWYKSTNQAEIDKTPEPMKILKRMENNRFMACFLKRSQPDYKGTLLGGKSIVFEAKHTDSGQIEQSRVTEAQVKALDRHQSMGASCFVVISFKMADFFRIPWQDWKDMKTLFGRKYVRAEELNLYKITIGRNGILMFLD